MKNRVEARILNWNDARYRSTQRDDITHDGSWDHTRGEQKSSNELWNENKRWNDVETSCPGLGQINQMLVNCRDVADP